MTFDYPAETEAQRRVRDGLPAQPTPGERRPAMHAGYRAPRRERVPMVRATIAAVAIIPDTPEARQAIRDLVERALLGGGVALQGMISKYDKPTEGGAGMVGAALEARGQVTEPADG